MIDKEKLSKVRAEIERRIKLHKDSLTNPIHQGFGLQKVINAKISELTYLLSFIDSMQEEPTSVWHDAKEKPIDGGYVALLHKNGTLCCYDYDSTLRYHWPSVVKWAYVGDLLKL